jgi:hypothetical protein
MTTENIPLLQMGSYLATLEKQTPVQLYDLNYFEKVFAWGLPQG